MMMMRRGLSLIGGLLVVFMTLICAEIDYSENNDFHHQPSLETPTTLPIEIRDQLLARNDFLQSIGHIPPASRKDFEANYGSTMIGIGNKVRLLQVFPH